MEEIKVFLHEGILVTDSRYVAKDFNRHHAHIIRSIRELMIRDNEYFRGLMDTGFSQSIRGSADFIESTFIDQQGKPRTHFLITRDGLVLLLMEFKCRKSHKFKREYIKDFNRMERYILETKEYLIKVHEETVASLRAENKALIEKASSILESTNYFKVRDYFNAQGINLTSDECKSIGFKATKYCNHKAIPIKPEFTSLGKTNTYPSNVLQMLHKQYVTSNFNALLLFN